MKGSAIDGPGSPLFSPLALRGNCARTQVGKAGVSAGTAAAIVNAPQGDCICRGIPFKVGRPLVICQRPVQRKLERVKTRWLVFMHATEPLTAAGLSIPAHGRELIGSPCADYVFIYADGQEERVTVRRGHQLAAYAGGWGRPTTEGVAHGKPVALPHPDRVAGWGHAQTRVQAGGNNHWTNWLWAWQNPRPDVPLAALRFEPADGATLVFAVSTGRVDAHPLRWETRRKLISNRFSGGVGICA